MIKEILYVCEKCGQHYVVENEAIKCEKSNFKPVGFGKGIHAITYRSPMDVEWDYRYPSKIRIEMEDGNYVTYYSSKKEAEILKD